MVPWLHEGPTKFALAGLDLNVPVDLVPPGKYSRATNVVSKVEGRIEARDGCNLIAQLISAATPPTTQTLPSTIPAAPTVDDIVTANPQTASSPFTYGPFSPKLSGEYVFSEISPAGVPSSLLPNGTAIDGTNCIWYSSIPNAPSSLTTAYSGSGGAAIAAFSSFIQGSVPIISQHNTSGGTGVLAFATPVAVGHSVLVALGTIGHIGTPVISVTDDKGNVYTQITYVIGSGSNLCTAGFWIAQNVQNGPKTITLTVSGGSVLTVNNYTIMDIANLLNAAPQITVPGSGPVDDLPIHSIFRLQQTVPSITGERLVGASTRLFSAPLPAGNTFTELTGFSFDGQPLSIIKYRFDADPPAWAIIGNSNGMRKRRDGFYWQLGVPPPAVQASAANGGAGLLDSSVTGIGYDWRYTYLNDVTQSESTPSPVTTPSGGGSATQVIRPTTFTNPAAGADTPFSSPSNAIDGNPATASGGSASATASGPSDSEAQTAGCVWSAMMAPSGAVSTLQLSVDREASLDTEWFGQARATSSYRIEYSVDGGMSWQTLESSHLTTNGSQVYARQTINASLSPSTPITSILVRAFTTATASTFGGGFGGGDATSEADLSIFEIYLTVNVQGGSTVTLMLTNEQASVCVTPPTDPQETSIRLYRRGGTLTNDWYRVGTFAVADLSQGACGSGTLEISDNEPDSTIEVSPSLVASNIVDNFMPVFSVQTQNQPLPVVFGPYDERVLGCGDPNRPESIYFSLRGNADIWPAENWVIVGDPGEQMMNGIVYALRCFAFSREGMSILLPNIVQGVTFTPSKTSCRRGLKGRWALCAGEHGIYFVSKDGVYRTQGGPEESIIDDSTRPLFPTREAPVGIPTNGYDAVDLSDENGLRLTFHNGEIWFYYTGLTTQTRQLMIYDERRSRWRASDYTPDMNMAYSEPDTSSSLLYGGTDGALYAAGGASDNGASIAVQLTTGAFDQGRSLSLKEYLNVQFDIDPGNADVSNPVVIIPRINGETASELALTITGSGRQFVTLPLADVYAYNLEFDITWSTTATRRPILYQYDALYRFEPAEVTHWELPPYGFGQQGWFHIRDVYIVLRSSADVTFQVIPDVGPAQTFTVPSTNGAKVTRYVKLAANKGNSFAMKLDSALPFRIYASECDVRCKEWLTNLGYKNVPVIAVEQQGTSLVG